ncbi:MAG TPA: DNA repair protein RecN [Myxococcales bacterium]|nr:DNA repair protein RecN [Myxococcales bacterium]
MLSALRISNLAVIEGVEVAFGPGLTVLTGETGAGKSILLGALGLLLGGRADPEAIRAGAEEATVEAIFTRTDTLAQRLEGAGLPGLPGPDAEEEVCVRRVLSRAGKGKASINGSLVTVGLLGRLLQGEVDVASQHEHVSLFDPARHRALLDRSGDLDPQLAAHGAAYRALQEVLERMAALGGDERMLRERADLLRYQLNELQSARPTAGEDARLEEERRRLAAAERLRRAAGEASALLSGEDEGAASARAARASALLLDAARVDAGLAGLAGRLQAAHLELDDCALELGRYLEHLAADPARLLEIDERLDVLRRLCRKHQADVAGLLERRRQLEEEVTALERREETLAALEQERAKAEAFARKTAEALTAARKEAATRLSRAVGQALADLALPKASFEIALSPGPLRERGADEVQFRFSANAGEPLRPLEKVASGGEASRLLLALKRALAASDPCATYVLDEADAGVSGGTAEVVARMLKEVSRHRQVLCITHLPQVAAYADAHLLVEKSQQRGRTLSRVRALGAEERTGELARMLSGLEVTPEAKGAALALIRAAARAAPRSAKTSWRARRSA